MSPSCLDMKLVENYIYFIINKTEVVFLSSGRRNRQVGGLYLIIYRFKIIHIYIFGRRL